jgi:hypothetical protein
VPKFEPWRERLKRADASSLSEAEASALDRQDEVTLLAIRVFGNYADAMTWMYQSTRLFGQATTPYQKASQGRDGLEAVKAVLAVLQTSVAPVYPKRRRRPFRNVE